MGLLNLVLELQRQATAHDAQFLKSSLYYFELRVPASVRSGPDTPYLFPLLLSPEAYRMSEPFAVDKAFTNGGGLFLEEQGIIAREITIRGNTGWKPKALPKGVGNFAGIGAPKNRSFVRNNIRSGQAMLVALSGQRHFQFLQDAVFRTYADLKQDPATAKGTELYFHVPKDDEHWRVIPVAFNAPRDAGKPLLYQYEITMLALKPGQVTDRVFTEDASVLDTLKEPYRVIRSAIVGIRSAIQDLSGVTGELRQFGGGFVSLLDGAVSVVEAAEKYVDGSASLIALPFDLSRNTVAAGLDALLQFNTGENQTTGTGAPSNLLNSIRKIVDGMDMINSYPGSFISSTQAAVARYQARTDASSLNRAALLAAAAQNPPSTIQGFAQLGSAMMPGDAARSDENLGLGRQTPDYLSALEYVLEAGDTLATLAAKFLDDARNWKYLALFNDLQPPFISEEGLPGTLGVGDTLMIPSLAPPVDVQTSPVTLGVRPGAPSAEQSLGVDFRLDPVDAGPPGQFDWVVDVDGGSIDLKRVAGISNLVQAMRTRLLTERGTDILYRTLGCGRVVGLGLTALDLETAQVRLAEAILADPRINAVREIRVSNDQPDSLVADVTAEVRGFARPETIQIAVAV